MKCRITFPMRFKERRKRRNSFSKLKKKYRQTKAKLKTINKAVCSLFWLKALNDEQKLKICYLLHFDFNIITKDEIDYPLNILSPIINSKYK
jgi:hypothetical protein